MSSTEPSSRSASAAEPVRYRLVVRSAAEAVAIVREKFGANAKVISVRQVEAGGLARFIQKPRLEVIVEVAPPKSIEPETTGGPGSVRAVSEDTSPAARTTIAPAARTESGPPENHAAASPTVAPVPPPAPAPADIPALTRAVANIAAAPSADSRREISLLRATGFDETVLERIRADHPGLDWNRTPAPEALARLVAWLRQHYERVPRRPIGPRRVFFGTFGAGKTTTMCKLLALDVFVRGRSAAVLKLDGEQPNATDGLAAFCDVLGAPLLRSAAEVEEFDRSSLLYIDVPGVRLDAEAEHARLAQTLDALRVDTRVLVVNAAYEAEIMADAFAMGRTLGATHAVFTHLDEVRRPGKLWRHVLFGGLRPIGLTSGPSPAGEIEEDVLSALLAHTFPRGLADVVRAEGGGRA